MKIPQAVREVIDKGPLAHLTTLNPNGSPQVTVVWVGIDGEEFVMGHFAIHQKIRNIRRDPRVALSLLGYNTTQGMREYVVVYGTARVTDGGAVPLLQRLAPIYLGRGGGISAGLDAEYCQNRAGTLLRDWSVGSTGRWLTHRRTNPRIMASELNLTTWRRRWQRCGRCRSHGPAARLNSSSAKCPSLRGPNFTTPFRPADGSRGESALGHEERFPPPRLNAGDGFRKETIAGMRRNGARSAESGHTAARCSRHNAVIRLGQVRAMNRQCQPSPSVLYG